MLKERALLIWKSIGLESRYKMMIFTGNVRCHDVETLECQERKTEVALSSLYD